MKINLTEVRQMIRRELVLGLVREAVERTILVEQAEGPSYDQNVELLRRYKEGDPSALNDLVMANRGLVRKIAHAYSKKSNIPFEDLEQGGYEGLLRALNKLEAGDDAETIKRKMSSWIRSQMQGQIGSNRSVHIGGRDERTILNGFTKAFSRLKQELGRDPTDEEVADELGVDVEKLKAVRSVGAVSTNMEVGEEGGSTFGDTLSDTFGATPEDTLMQRDFYGLLDRFEDNLSNPVDKLAVQVLKGDLTNQQAADQVAKSTGGSYTRAAMNLRVQKIKDTLKKFLGAEAMEYTEFFDKNVAV